MNDKPTAEQVAWVLNILSDHLHEGGTFRKLIYDRMEFKPADYEALYVAGGMKISNALNSLHDMDLIIGKIDVIVDKLATDANYSRGEAVDDLRIAIYGEL